MNGPADGNSARRYPHFDPMGEGGLIDPFTPQTSEEIKRWLESGLKLWGTRISDFEVVEVRQPRGWPPEGWETLFAPAHPSRRAILDWLIALEGDAESKGELGRIAAELKNRPPAEHMKHVAGNCKAFMSDLQRLVTYYGDECPALGETDLPTDEFVNVDAARKVLRKVRARLLQEIATAEGVDRRTLPTESPIVAASVAPTHSAVPDHVPVETGQAEGGKPACRETAAPTGGAASATRGKGNGRGKNINARMMNMLLDDASRRDWSARKWADALECREGTVKETRAWEQIMNMRLLEATERMTRDEDRVGGRRKRRD